MVWSARSRVARVLGLVAFWAVLSVQAVSPGPVGVPPSPRGVYSFKAFGAEDGLMNPSVTTLVRDGAGQLWVGTEDGLYRQEGRRFRRYGVEEGLPSAYVYYLVAPEDGGLWVITNLGVRFWNGRTLVTSASRGVPGIDAADGYDSLLTRTVLVDNVGLLLLDGEAPRLATGTGALRSLPELKGCDGSVLAAWGSLRHQELLLADRRELIAWQGGRVARRSLKPFTDAGGWVRAMMRDRSGTLWLRTLNSLLSIRAFDDRPVRVSGREAMGHPNYGVDLREDANGRIWTSTTRGLFWAQGGETGWMGEAEGLAETGGSFHFAFDGEDNLWVATETLLLQPGRRLWTNHGRQQGLPSNMVWRIARGGDGRLWAVTQMGLACAQGDAWKAMAESKKLPFFTVERDPEGSLWFAGATSLPGGPPFIWRVRSGETWPRRIPLVGAGDPKAILEMAFDRQGQLWLASQERGLLKGRFDGQAWHVESVPVPSWAPHEKIGQLISGPGGSLWAARSAGGLAVREEDGSWQVIEAGMEVPRAGVGVLKASPGGEVWASYVGEKRIDIFHQKDGRWRVARRILPPHPLVQHMVLAMAFEPDGTLMLGNSRGVLRWTGTSLEQFGRDWGMAGEDVAQAALWRDPNGDWWVGTTAGASRFERAMHRPRPPLSTMHIERVVDGDGCLVVEPEGVGRIRVPARCMPLLFHVHPEGYLAYLRASVQYRLQGLDERWRTAESAVVDYSSLPSGSYTFETRLLGSDGTVGPVSRFQVEILPPWYLAGWARVLWSALALGVMVLFHRFRARQLLRRAEHMERLVAARTADLEQALHEVKTLRGLLPICMYCKRIRSDEGAWDPMERYISEHTEAQFSHGVCPDCREEARQDLRILETRAED